MKRKREAETVNRRGHPKICSSDEIPEFFQVYLPEWNSRRLSIPSEFIKHFNGNIPTKVVLKDLGGNFWFVDMEEDENAVHFASGWQDFVKKSSLQKGEFLVLRYNGSSSFTIRIFGTDACMKDNYLAMDKIAIANIKSEAASETESKSSSTDTQNSPKIPEQSRGSFQLSGPIGHKKSRKRLMNQRFSLTAADVIIEDDALKAAYELMSSSKHPTFKIIMPQTYLERNYLDIPPCFVKRHMKKDTKQVELLIKNKSWPVNLTSPQRNRICKGWRKCQRGNSFQIGDVCVFELIDRDKPVLKVSVFRNQ